MKKEEIAKKLRRHINEFGYRIDGRIEWFCNHGLGHTVWYPKKSNGVHGCDGCCNKIDNGQIILTWGAYGVLINRLAKKIKLGKKRFDGIYGIPRGGLPVAVTLSHQLNLPLLLYPTEKSLIVDDISDTGKTLLNYKNRCIATLYSTKWTKTKPDYYIDEKFSKKDWILFPWEIK